MKHSVSGTMKTVEGKENKEKIINVKITLRREKENDEAFERAGQIYYQIISNIGTYIQEYDNQCDF